MVYYKKRKSKAPRVIVILLIAALVLGAAGYFGFNAIARDLYPVKYERYVEKYAAEHNISPYLVYAVIKTESGFNSNARSNVGARGLMQIMEDTFEWIKFKRGDEETTYYEMYDPEKNIDYGCWFLGYLYEEFGNVDCVAAAYHAGRGNVNKWLSQKEYSADGKHLDKIPISDTAHYVDKINGAVDMYKFLYPKK